MAIGYNQIVFDRAAGLQSQAAANIFALHIADPLLIEQVELEAVAALHKTGHAQQNLIVNQRDVDRALPLEMGIIACAGRNITAKFIGRLGRGEEHRATRRVATEQGSLRTLQHLH